MRLRMSKSDIVFTVFVVAAIAALLLGLGLLPIGEKPTNSPASVATLAATGNVIVRENALAGTTGWMIPANEEATTEIQAYASATSVLPGQKMTFYVSTQKEGTLYSIGIYRLGWYEGLGGRLEVLQSNLIGHAQGYYDPAQYKLVGCNSCHVDAQTGLVEANWQPSYTLTVSSDWVTGVYLAKFADANGMQTYVPFDVRGNPHSAYIAVTSDTTYEAYNNWGGSSLYAFNSSPKASSTTEEGFGGVKVSFDRPYMDGAGSADVLAFEADAIHWFERQGYDLSYISSVDLHEDPAQLLQHRAYLSLGHDEYWTKDMRDGVEHARDKGVGLAFLGADAAYWQMRFEPDSAGTPNRTIVCYKVQTDHNDLARDPLYGHNNVRVTAQWRDPVLARPENALIGIMYNSLTDAVHDLPWRVSPTAKSVLLDGTGLQPGQQYGCGLVGYEWDRVFANGATPARLQVLGVSHTIDAAGKPDVSNTTYYIASSGALVFATGSISWTASLDSYRFSPISSCAGRDTVVPGMQQLMAHVMQALLVSHSSQQLPLTSTALEA